MKKLRLMLSSVFALACLGANAALPGTATVVTPNFIQTEWDQHCPYNDFMPLTYEGTSVYPYNEMRGRCYAGCVPVAYSQMMAYWKWPYSFDMNRQVLHSVRLDPDDSNDTTNITYRVNGYAPVNWDLMKWLDRTEVGRGDLRGSVSEQSRYDAARLVLMAGSLAGCYYGADETGAAYPQASGNPWYTPAPSRFVDKHDYLGDNWEDFIAPLREAITNGCPVLVSVGGHAVVGSGWAEDADAGKYYIYLCYGYAGVHDDWYLIDKNFNGSIYAGSVHGYVLGQTPIPAPQVEHLPPVVTSSPTIKWHIADCHANKVTGFSIDIAERVDTPIDITDDFTTAKGVASSPYVTVGYTNDYVHAGVKMLRFRTGKGWDAAEDDVAQTGEYSYSEPFLVNSKSELTFDVMGDGTHGYEFSAVLTDANGDEYVLPMLQPSVSWSERSFLLNYFAGKVMRLSFRSAYDGENYNLGDRQGFFVKNLALKSVMSFGAKSTVGNIAATERERAISGLTAGKQCLITVNAHYPDKTAAAKPESVIVEGEAVVMVPASSEKTEKTSYFTLGDPEWSGNYVKSGQMSINGVLLSFIYPSDSDSGSLELPIDEVMPTTTFNFTYVFRRMRTMVAKVDFIESSGTVTTLKTLDTSGYSTNVWQTESISLASLAGKSGKLSLTSYHTVATGAQQPNYGVFLQAGSVSCGPYLKAAGSGDVATKTVTLTACEPPAILAVNPARTNLVDNIMLEAGLTTPTKINVRCSETAVKLAAYPSCPSLMPDNEVAVAEKGGGLFEVTLSPTRMVKENNDRTRMILTLVAEDANGGRGYRDIVLRFSTESDGGDPEPPPTPPATYEYLVWNGGESGVWKEGGAGWIDDQGYERTFASDDKVVFPAGGAATKTVTVEIETPNVGGMTINDAYTFDTAADKSATFSAASVAIADAGKMTLGERVTLDYGTATQPVAPARIAGSGTIKVVSNLTTHEVTVNLTNSPDFTGTVDFAGNFNARKTSANTYTDLKNATKLVLSQNGSNVGSMWTAEAATIAQEIFFKTNYGLMGNNAITLAGAVTNSAGTTLSVSSGTVKFTGLGSQLAGTLENWGALTIGDGVNAASISIAGDANMSKWSSGNSGQKTLQILANAEMNVGGAFTDNSKLGLTNNGVLNIKGSMEWKSNGGNYNNDTLGGTGVTFAKKLLVDNATTKLSLNGGILIIGADGMTRGGTSVVRINDGMVVGASANWTAAAALPIEIVGSATINTGTFDLGSKTFSESSGATVTMAGAISGTGNLVKAGAGTLVFNGANTYTGATAINGGVVQLGNTKTQTTGKFGTGDVTVADGAGVVFNRTNLTIANNFTFGDSTFELVDAGGEQAQRVAFTLSGAITLNGNLLYKSQYNPQAVIEGKISGAGSIEFGGAAHSSWGSNAVLTLTNAENDFAGGIKVSRASNAELRVTDAGALGAGGVNLENATSRLKFASGATSAYAGAVTGAGAVDVTRAAEPAPVAGEKLASGDYTNFAGEVRLNGAALAAADYTLKADGLFYKAAVTWPDAWPQDADAAVTGRFAAWLGSKAPGKSPADFAAEDVDYFLMNVAPGAAIVPPQFTAVEVAGSKLNLTSSIHDGDVNGIIFVRRAEQLGDIDAEGNEYSVDLADGKTTIEGVDAASAAGFFKLVVGTREPAKPLVEAKEQ